MATLVRIAAFASLAAVTACGSGTETLSADKPCTAIGSREGVGLDVKAPYAAKIGSATMKVCWNGTCRTSKVELQRSSVTVPQKCEGTGPDAACAASASPTDDKTGFAEVQGLPKAPVKVTVDLRDTKGKRLPSKTIDVTPHATYPNGKDCDEGKPSATLALGPDGKLSQRR